MLLLAGYSAAPASATVSLTAAPNPARAGSAGDPAPLALALDARIDGTTPVTALVEALPAEFTDELQRFATCPRAIVEGANERSGPPGCPDGSLLGDGALAAYAYRHTARSDHGYIYRVGAGAIELWWHVAGPPAIAGTIRGTVALRFDGRPQVAWDLRPYAEGLHSAGSPVVIQALLTDYRLAGTVTVARRRRAVPAPRCRHSCQRHRTRRRRRARRAQAPSSPFAAAGCAGGAWRFDLDVAYDGGARQHAAATAACTAPAPASPDRGSGSGGAPGGGPPGGGNPISPLPGLPLPAPGGIAPLR